MTRVKPTSVNCQRQAKSATAKACCLPRWASAAAGVLASARRPRKASRSSVRFLRLGTVSASTLAAPRVCLPLA
nr:hypothetical protein [Shewanella algae]